MRHLLILITLIVCSSCIAQDPYVVLGGERFTVELAETQEKQALGLMFRDEMPDDHGMLFLFPGEARRSFWMKNTRIPLDIFYFEQGPRIGERVGEHSALPVTAVPELPELRAGQVRAGTQRG